MEKLGQTGTNTKGNLQSEGRQRSDSVSSPVGIGGGGKAKISTEKTVFTAPAASIQSDHASDSAALNETHNNLVDKGDVPELQTQTPHESA